MSAVLDAARASALRHAGASWPRGVRPSPPGSARAVVHYHIFKNAGTSVDRSLSQAFGNAWISLEGATPTSRVAAETLRRCLAANPTIRAISSHQARPPVPTDVLPVIFLRHPVLRAYSVWAFARRDPTQPNHACAREGGFADYIRWAEASCDGGVVIRDYQVIHLSRASWRVTDLRAASAGLDDCREAEALLAALPAFGLVELFARSARLFERRYQPHLPGFAMPVFHENRSTPAGEPPALRLHRIRREVGERLYRRLLDMNANDLRLYHAARELFSRRATEAGV